MLKSYPKYLAKDIGPIIIIWKLTSYSGSGMARYKSITHNGYIQISGPYPKKWNENLAKHGYRELTETEKVLYGR